MGARGTLGALATILVLAALPGGAHAWRPGQRLPPDERWELLPVRTRQGAHRAISFDGHVHSDHSHDADHPTADVLDLARRVGLDAVIVTDHGSSHAALDVARDAYAGPVTVMVGEEIGGEWGHAVVWNVPDRRGVLVASGTIRSLGAMVHARGGVLVLAHPGWWIDGNEYDPRLWMQLDALRRGGIADEIDAIEIWNQVYFQPSRRLIDEWDGLLERGVLVPIVGNSDFHRTPAHDLGVPRNVALCAEPVDDVAGCILDAVRAGRLYVTDGPSIAMVAGGRTFGETVPAVPGTPMVVAIRARAPLGGTLELRVGRAIAHRVPLPPGETVETTLVVPVPSHDSFLRAEIARATPIDQRTPFSLLTNPVMIDVAPWSSGWRGPDVGRVAAPLGFSRRDVLRRERQEAERRAAREARREERRRMRGRG